MNYLKKHGSTISVAISLIALSISICRCEPIKMDWLGVLVGILSLLVTAILGWQIYSVIDIKKTVSEIKSHTNRTQEETMARAYTSIMNQTVYIIEGREDDDCYNAIANGLYACKHYHLAGNDKECSNLLSILSNFRKKNCSLSKQHIANLWIIIGQLKECGVDAQNIEKWLSDYEK